MSKVALQGALIIGILALGLSSASPANAAAPATPFKIAFHFAYRGSVSQEHSATMNFTLTGTGEQITTKVANVGEFQIEAQLSDASYEVRSVRVAISTNNNRLVSSQLFQIANHGLPGCAFVGHGFSGLNYVYHPKTEAELQYWVKIAGQAAP